MAPMSQLKQFWGVSTFATLEDEKLLAKYKASSAGNSAFSCLCSCVSCVLFFGRFAQSLQKLGLLFNLMAQSHSWSKKLACGGCVVDDPYRFHTQL